MSTEGQLEIKTFPLVWKVNNFSDIMCKNKGMWVQSPIFEVSDGTKKGLWQILLFIPEEEESYFKLFLRYLHDVTTFQDENFCFKFSLVDNTGKEMQKRVSTVRKFDSHCKSWGWPQYIQKRDITNKKVGLLVENILTIFCEINMNLYSSDEVRLKADLDNVYEQFYLNEKFSDVTIIVEQEKIKVHRMVLSAKSKVFTAMLEHDMKENNTHTIEINDISLGIIKELLSFMYCGKVNNLTEIAKPLLVAADKYDVSLLKVKCERAMNENLNTENACETLVTSDLHNCQKLKTETIDFIIENIIKVTKTSKFMELKRLNPKLLEEILHRIAEQKTQKM